MAALAVGTLSVLLISENVKAVYCANKFPQPEYTLKHEIMELNYYNRDYFKDLQVILFWYNRTTRAFNMSTYLKKDLGLNLRFNATLYKFMNNQYRFYPAEFRRNVCDLLENNLFGCQDITKLVSVEDCPTFKGYYSISNLLPDTSKFPRYLLPFGRYKVYGNLYDLDIHLTTTSWYGEIKPIDPFY